MELTGAYRLDSENVVKGKLDEDLDLTVITARIKRKKSSAFDVIKKAGEAFAPITSGKDFVTRQDTFSASGLIALECFFETKLPTQIRNYTLTALESSFEPKSLAPVGGYARTSKFERMADKGFDTHPELEPIERQVSSYFHEFRSPPISDFTIYCGMGFTANLLDAAFEKVIEGQSNTLVDEAGSFLTQAAKKFGK